MVSFSVLKETFEPYVIGMRRVFHENPELSGAEQKTAERIRAELDKAGISWRACGKKMPQGTLAEIQGASPGKTILLRADMDALPVTENTGLPFASRTPGVMHACGHDCHMAMLLTAARMLQSVKNEFSGTVRFIFQPSEEAGNGARDMIEDGVLDGVGAVFGMHIAPDLPSGRVSIQPGARMGSVDKFRIDIRGESGHAALPQKCHDATPAAAAVVTAAQTIVSRETDPLSPAVVTIGVLHSGTRWNVTSGEAYIEGTVRCFDEIARRGAEEGLRRISEGVAAAHRCSAELRYERLSDPVVNDPEFTRMAREAAVGLFGKDSPAEILPTAVGEDFGYYSSKAKTVFAMFGVGNPACGACHPLHSDRCTADEKALIGGALLHLSVALRYLDEKK